MACSPDARHSAASASWGSPSPLPRPSSPHAAATTTTSPRPPPPRRRPSTTSNPTSAPKADTIRFQGPAGELQAAWAAPSAPTAQRGAVLVIHENRGLTPHFFDVVGRLAGAGYGALCVDLLSAQGGTASLKDPAGAPAALASAPTDQLVAELRAGIDELQRRVPDKKVGAVGFCFGGGMAWNLLNAHETRLAAAVPFYGPAPDNLDFTGAKAAVLAIYGELDDAGQRHARPRRSGAQSGRTHLRDPHVSRRRSRLLQRHRSPLQPDGRRRGLSRPAGLVRRAPQLMPRHPIFLSRRALLQGAAVTGAAVLVGACSSDDRSGRTAGTTSTSSNRQAPRSLPPTPACHDGDEPTPAQTAGPFFTPNSPEKRASSPTAAAARRSWCRARCSPPRASRWPERCSTSGRPTPMATTTMTASGYEAISSPTARVVTASRPSSRACTRAAPAICT